MHFLYSESWNNALHTPAFVLLNKQPGRELKSSVTLFTVDFLLLRLVPVPFATDVRGGSDVLKQ